MNVSFPFESVSSLSCYYNFDKIDDFIEAGRYGNVYKAVTVCDRKGIVPKGANVAIKEIAKNSVLSVKDVQSVINEVEVLKLLHHKNTVYFIEALQSPSSVYIIMELVPDSQDLFKILRMREKGGSEDNERWVAEVAQQLLEGIEYLHTKLKIVHRDLKPENILCSFSNEDGKKTMRVVIVDYGHAKYIGKHNIGSFLKGVNCSGAFINGNGGIFNGNNSIGINGNGSVTSVNGNNCSGVSSCNNSCSACGGSLISNNNNGNNGISCNKPSKGLPHPTVRRQCSIEILSMRSMESIDNIEEDERQMPATPCGTLGFASPEIIRVMNEGAQIRYTTRKDLFKSDIFSIGIILYAMLSGRLPYNGRTKAELLLQQETGPSFDDPVWEVISPEARQLVELCLNPTPSLRPSIQRALCHNWLASLNGFYSNNGNVDVSVNSSSENGCNIGGFNSICVKTDKSGSAIRKIKSNSSGAVPFAPSVSPLLPLSVGVQSVNAITFASAPSVSPPASLSHLPALSSPFLTTLASTTANSNSTNNSQPGSFNRPPSFRSSASVSQGDGCEELNLKEDLSNNISNYISDNSNINSSNGSSNKCVEEENLDKEDVMEVDDISYSNNNSKRDYNTKGDYNAENNEIKNKSSVKQMNKTSLAASMSPSNSFSSPRLERRATGKNVSLSLDKLADLNTILDIACDDDDEEDEVCLLSTEAVSDGPNNLSFSNTPETFLPFLSAKGGNNINNCSYVVTSGSLNNINNNDNSKICLCNSNCRSSSNTSICCNNNSFTHSSVACNTICIGSNTNTCNIGMNPLMRGNNNSSNNSLSRVHVVPFKVSKPNKRLGFVSGKDSINRA